MAVLTDAESQLKENYEMRTGLDKTNQEFKQMLKNSKSLQQQLRAINRELDEQSDIYKEIKQTNEKFYDSLDKRRYMLKDLGKNIYNSLLSSQKVLNGVADDFKEFTNKLNTGNVSLKEYKKNFDKLGNIETILSNQKILLEEELGNSKTRLDSFNKEYIKKNKIYERFSKKTKEDFQKDISAEEKQLEYSIMRKELLENRKSKTKLKKDIIPIDKEIKFEEKKQKDLQKNIENLRKKYELSISKDELGKLESLKTTEKIKNSSIKGTIKDIHNQQAAIQNLKAEYKSTEIQIKKNEKALGNVGRIMGVMQHLGVNRIFDFEKIEDSMQAAAQRAMQLRSVGEKAPIMGTLRAGVGAMGSELTSKFGVVGAVGGGIWLGKQILDLFFQADERTKAISKNQAITRNDAEGILATYSKISVANERISIFGQSIATTAATQKELLETSLSISNGLGLNYNIANKAEGDLLVNIKERMGLSEESRQIFLENSRLSDESLNDYLNSILGVNVVNKANNKFYMNDKALLNDVSKLSSTIRLQFKNHSSDLSQIVINSKKYGLEISKIDSSMNSMMDWEKQAELQTSFFSQTGKYIDTSRLQFFSMYNMVENYQEELNKLLGEEEDFMKLPRLVRQTKAELLGLNDQEAADIFLKKNINKKFSKEELVAEEQLGIMTRKRQKEQIDALIAQGYSMQFITKYMGEIDTKLMSDITSAENFQRALEKIKDTFATFVNKGGVESLIDSVTGMTQNIHSFLEKWGDVLGVKTKTSVLEKYNAIGLDRIMGDDKGILSLRQNLLSKDSDVSTEANADLKLVIKEMALQNGFKEDKINGLYNSIINNINRSDIFSLMNVPLEEFVSSSMESYTKKYKGITNQKVDKINDGIISPNGKVVVQTPLGQINTNPKDYLIATPSPNELLQKNAQQVSQFMIDDTKIVTTLQMITKAVEKSTQDIVKAVSANKDVYLNQRKVGEMFNINNQRV